jgi:hypothetical protein
MALLSAILWASLCALALFPTIGFCGQSRGVPYDPNFHSTFSETTPKESYPGIFENIQKVDFRNFSVPESDAKLKKGWFEHRDKAGYETVKLDSIHYLPSEDPDRQYVVVLYTTFFAGGSSSTEGIAAVFELFDHRLALKQQIDWDEHFETSHPYVSFNSKSNSLIVRTAHYLPGAAHCCVSAADVVTLRWNGTHFVKRAVRVELSNRGIQEGKKL